MDPFNQLILVISVTSFFTFQWLFHRVSPWLSVRISPGFLGLSDKQKVEWNSRTVSTFHALLVGIFCLYILFFDDAVNEDPVWGDPTLVKTNVAITTGYLISDLLLIFYYWKAIGDKFFVVHHLAALYAYYYVLGQGMLPYFANFRLLAEFSTPCVNQRFHSYTTAWRINDGSLRCWVIPSPPGPTWQMALPWQWCFSSSASVSCQSTTVACMRSMALRPSTWCHGVVV
ncbi:TLC domain-containing protein 4-B isoform X2 [Simochromis diagramma]|uniref:TLC domain-containing protein 4-B isoform X2 n=1 Tax=Simochromis diagramma TaxID=43689 RepID=UPI001A7ED2CB|nr:TLC domain-containing protein 4-B isoform X2 [Simochromis diagramma]